MLQGTVKTSPKISNHAIQLDSVLSGHRTGEYTVQFFSLKIFYLCVKRNGMQNHLLIKTKVYVNSTRDTEDK
jgi:hypothetical protein